MDQAVMNRPALDKAEQDGMKGGGQDNVIVANGLTKVYGGATAVDHVSFKVGRGEIFGLLGPNGAGKTTTILMMLGLTDISSGDVSVLGFNPARQPLSVKRRVGYLPDTVGFYDHLSAADNMRYTARLIGFYRAEREKRIADALARVGLSEVADNRVATFSRGMRQRLGLAEILMKGAQIAILDEPTSGLDPQATTELLAIIRGFKAEGVSVLLSSHLLERVQSVCDRVALFSAGKIALMGTVADLGRQVLGGGYTVDIEADGAGLAERLALIPGVSGVEKTGIGKLRLHADRDVRPEAAAEVVAMQGRLKFLGVQEPSLEAIYTRYFENNSEAPVPPEGTRHAA
jgi:ABC-2 type transport system ATP-binding protein